MKKFLTAILALTLSLPTFAGEWLVVMILPVDGGGFSAKFRLISARDRGECLLIARTDRETYFPEEKVVQPECVQILLPGGKES